MHVLFTFVNKLCQEEPIVDNRFWYLINSIGKSLENMFLKVFKSKLVHPVTQDLHLLYKGIPS